MFFLDKKKEFLIGVKFDFFEKTKFRKESFFYGKVSDEILKVNIKNNFWFIFAKKINNKLFYQFEHIENECQLIKIYIKQIKSVKIFFNGILNRDKLYFQNYYTNYLIYFKISFKLKNFFFNKILKAINKKY